MVRNPYIFIQARMNSERLPGKVLKMINGSPLIGILFDRIRDVGIPIILLTSTETENDVLANFSENNGLAVFRGSEENVLERFYFAAQSVNADVIIRLTGDNPFLEGRLVSQVLDYYKHFDNSRIYLSTGLSKTFPIGISVEVFSFELLEEAYRNAKDPWELEHVTPFIHQNVAGDVVIKKYSGKMNKYNYRLTVDTIEDFELVRCLIEEYDCKLKSIHDIIEVLDHHRDLLEINMNVSQRS